MMCPVCKRDLAPTLSICLTCGAMINDTVREELETKISRSTEAATGSSGRLSAKPAGIKEPPKKIDVAPPKQAAAPPAPKPIAARFETADLGTKKTSKTLV